MIAKDLGQCFGSFIWKIGRDLRQVRLITHLNRLPVTQKLLQLLIAIMFYRQIGSIPWCLILIMKMSVLYSLLRTIVIAIKVCLSHFVTGNMPASLILV